LAKSAGNVFPAEFTQKSAGKAKSFSNGWLATKKVGAEPGLVLKLAGGGSALIYNYGRTYATCYCSDDPRPLILIFLS